jgi:hypothetical protein
LRAKTQLTDGKDQQVSRLGQEIITDQQSELELMQLLQGTQYFVETRKVFTKLRTSAEDRQLGPIPVGNSLAPIRFHPHEYSLLGQAPGRFRVRFTVDT